MCYRNPVQEHGAGKLAQERGVGMQCRSTGWEFGAGAQCKSAAQESNAKMWCRSVVLEHGTRKVAEGLWYRSTVRLALASCAEQQEEAVSGMD